MKGVTGFGESHGQFLLVDRKYRFKSGSLLSLDFYTSAAYAEGFSNYSE